jgi:aspartate/methionine/tyrosine aminotransferase
VHVLTRRDELDEDEAGFRLGVAFSPAEEVHEALQKSAQKHTATSRMPDASADTVLQAHNTGMRKEHRR